MDLGIDRFQRVFQYFWDPEPRNTDHMNSIWLLGVEYSPLPVSQQEQHSSSAPSSQAVSAADKSKDGRPSSPLESAFTASINTVAHAFNNHHLNSNNINDDHADPSWPPEFLDDFESRIWMTYRQDIAPIPRHAQAQLTFATRFRNSFGGAEKEGFVDDTNWGCMIRSAQCVLANALAKLRLGREWRRGQRTLEEKELLCLFADDPRAPFSIHKFVHHGEAACGKLPGEWFGPSAAARCIQALSDEHATPDLHVYFAGDGNDVYEDLFLKSAKQSGAFQPTLLLISLRLGLERINPLYYEALKASLCLSSSVGIAGGRPSSSHYFVGVQGDYFFYLDPHFTRTGIKHHENPADMTQEEVDSCHTRRLRRLHVKEMDPSMLLAFLIRDEDEWKAWRRGVEEVQGKRIIHVADTAPPTPAERQEALEEIESFDDTDEEDGNDM